MFSITYNLKFKSPLNYLTLETFIVSKVSIVLHHQFKNIGNRDQNISGCRRVVFEVWDKKRDYGRNCAPFGHVEKNHLSTLY